MDLKSIIISNRFLYNVARNIQDFYGNFRVKKVISAYKKNPNKFLNKLSKNNKFMVIKSGKHNFQTFSAFYLNNMLGLMLECLMKGYIPIIDYKVKGKRGKSNNWSDFFEQPISISQSNNNFIEFKKKNNIYKPSFKYIYDRNKCALWGYIYNEFVKFNDETRDYINNEYNNILSGKRVLGVICRGTDYIDTRPKYHPIQPDINKVIADAEYLMIDRGYHYIYLATEDETYFQFFRQKFGSKVLTNKRKYYDKEYKKLGENALLFSVDLGRENEQYRKGLEYLSSIFLLSKCNALIGGHCGGSDMAIYFNNCKYEYVHIYNCGIY